MRRYSLLALFAIAVFLVRIPGAQAQSALLDLPRDSQRATVAQRIGITDITIRYHGVSRAVVAAAGIEDESAGFSSTPHLIEQHQDLESTGTSFTF